MASRLARVNHRGIVWVATIVHELECGTWIGNRDDERLAIVGGGDMRDLDGEQIADAREPFDGPHHPALRQSRPLLHRRDIARFALCRFDDGPSSSVPAREV